jgi:D-glycero-D-manno-heptose 1,7-bisphosphate phosphatase
MPRPAVFFDRDNTLIVGNEYLGNPEEVKLVDGAPAAVARVRDLGYATVVVSNQSGVARGYFTEDAVRAVNARIDELLLRADVRAVIDLHEYCPYHPDGTVEAYRRDSDLRKPRPGMLIKASETLDLDLKRSWMVGDAPRDIEAGAAVGCRTILIIDRTLAPSPAAAEQQRARPDFTVASLREAVAVIERHTHSTTEPGTLAPTTREPLAGPSRASDDPQLKQVLQQLLVELRRRHEGPVGDFSVTKLLAGVAQILALAGLFLAYLNRRDHSAMVGLMLLSIFLQTLTIALLLMGRRH